MAEVLGRGGHIASQVVNCSAPDTGNMGALSFSLFFSSSLISMNQNRGFGQVRNPRTTEGMVGALVGRKDSLGFRHDGTVWYELIQVKLYRLLM